MNQKIYKEKQKLDNLFSLVNNIPVDEFEMKSHWAKYLCILVSGFIENSLKIIVTEYTKNTAAPPIVNFVEKKIKRITNLRFSRVEELLLSFDKQRASIFIDTIDDSEKIALTSIVTLRNSIAHGINVGVTYHSIKDYYDIILITIKKVEKFFEA